MYELYVSMFGEYSMVLSNKRYTMYFTKLKCFDLVLIEFPIYIDLKI